MKKYETFFAWSADRHAYQKKMVTALRKFVKKAAPSLIESVKWGNGVWLGEVWPVAFLHAKDDHLQFGFFGGTGLTDPKKILQGKGKHVKPIKIYALDDILPSAFSRLLREAAAHERE